MNLVTGPATQEVRDALERALSHLEQCLLILDESGAPGDIGAHVDLAAERVAAILEQFPGVAPTDQTVAISGASSAFIPTTL